MVDFDTTFLSNNGFIHSIAINHLMDNLSARKSIPRVKGVYVVASERLVKKEFLKVGTGGRFRKKDWNVGIEKLDQSWGDNSRIFYIGQAGGFIKGEPIKSELYTRIKDLVRFVDGHGAPHTGGRYLWQLACSRELLVYYKNCPGMENPREIEKQLIKEYKDYYGKRPFANLID